jgi:hypothetical protein
MAFFMGKAAKTLRRWTKNSLLSKNRLPKPWSVCHPHFLMRPLLFAALTLSSVFAGDATVIEKTPGLVGFWTFGEEAGQKRVSQGTKEKHPLSEVNGPIKRSTGGPFSGYAADLNGSQYFEIKHSETGDLNISGKDAQVSMFAVVRIVDLKKSRTIAGMWSEGKGANDDTGTRQYALLMNMPTYGGNAPARAAHQQRGRRDDACRRHEIPLVRRLRRHETRSAGGGVVYARLHLRFPIPPRLHQRRARRTAARRRQRQAQRPVLSPRKAPTAKIAA